MPLTYIAIREGKAPAYKQALIDEIYEAMRETVAIEDGDRFMTISEHGEHGFAFGPFLGIDRSDDLVQVQLSVPVDEQRRTNVAHILAIGDVAGAPMLAHKASHEANVAAEVIAGHDVAWDARGIPSVAYTDPEVAWIGLSVDRVNISDAR